jgi:hypothetical protein
MRYKRLNSVIFPAGHASKSHVELKKDQSESRLVRRYFPGGTPTVFLKTLEKWLCSENRANFNKNTAIESGLDEVRLTMVDKLP